MIKNYFKIAWRNLVRNKAFSANQKEMAINSYKKSLAINPDNEDIKKKLKELGNE
jgi:hypothetical protein